MRSLLLHAAIHLPLLPAQQAIGPLIVHSIAPSTDHRTMNKTWIYVRISAPAPETGGRPAFTIVTTVQAKSEEEAYKNARDAHPGQIYNDLIVDLSKLFWTNIDELVNSL